MNERLPLFPLGTVLFPGLVLPLRVFEERYQALVRHLVDSGEEPATFGVVAIRSGWEVGEGETAMSGVLDRSVAVTLHDVGCTAEIRQLTPHPDGRFDLVTVGRRRFRVKELHADGAPYLTADIDWIEDQDGTDPRSDRLMPGLLDLFQRYLEIIRTDGQAGGEQLPDDPTVLSYLIAATAVLSTDDRQKLLATAATADRLGLERRLLGREMALLRHIRALPIPLGDLASAPSVN
jgi:Lon protease-like protein